MAKKKTSHSSLLEEYVSREANETQAAIYADMKSRIRDEGADQNALDELLVIHRRRNNGETPDSIAEILAKGAKRPAPETTAE